jgi:hypothetical protein
MEGNEKKRNGMKLPRSRPERQVSATRQDEQSCPLIRDPYSDFPSSPSFAILPLVQGLYFDSRSLLSMTIMTFTCNLYCQSHDGLSFKVLTLIRNRWFNSQSSF